MFAMLYTVAWEKLWSGLGELTIYPWGLTVRAFSAVDGVGHLVIILSTLIHGKPLTALAPSLSNYTHV